MDFCFRQQPAFKILLPEKFSISNRLLKNRCYKSDCPRYRKKFKINWFSVLNRTRKYRTERGAIYNGIAMGGQGLYENFCVNAEQFVTKVFNLKNNCIYLP
jgi:hypothetical protein